MNLNFDGFTDQDYKIEKFEDSNSNNFVDSDDNIPVGTTDAIQESISNGHENGAKVFAIGESHSLPKQIASTVETLYHAGEREFTIYEEHPEDLIPENLKDPETGFVR